MTISDKIKKSKIFFSGGGTGGSVAPLIAVYEELKNDNDYLFYWVGTKDGVERKMLKSANIKYFSINCGKLRRYWSWQNFVDVINFMHGLLQSFFILAKERPDIIISAGSFVSVPLVWVGWFFRIPVLIHQQDVRAGLANKLMSWSAKKVSVTFAKSLKDYGRKAVLIGNPIRKELIEVRVSKQEALAKLGLVKDKPVLLILGGGTGSLAINKLIESNLDNLSKFLQIIHITGRGKSIICADKSNYHGFEFLDTFGLIKVFAAADVVVSRCGMSVLSELSFFGLPSILIPIPNSHQEVNAQLFAENKAAIVIDQGKISDIDFVKIIRDLMGNQAARQELSINIQKIIKKGANQELVKIIKELINERS